LRGISTPKRDIMGARSGDGQGRAPCASAQKSQLHVKVSMQRRQLTVVVSAD